MLQFLKKLKLNTKLDPKTIQKYSDQNLFMIIYRLPAPTKVVLQLEHHIEPLLHM